jgi:hypothetical protein
MNIEDFYTPIANGISFSRDQASGFAKNIADDFNPIHDIDAKRFCVPGDLLFSIALSKFGLYNTMQVTFSGMVNAETPLQFNHIEAGKLDIVDANEKVYLTVEHQGQQSNNQAAISKLIEQYVGFSGKTFPHILVPLWKSKGVMVNPDRPMVIYQSMTINMTSLDFSSPSIEATTPEIDVNGKRGNVVLRFNFKDGDRKIGTGEKHMILSGLKDYDQTAIDDLITFYNQRKIDLSG